MILISLFLLHLRTDHGRCLLLKVVGGKKDQGLKLQECIYRACVQTSLGIEFVLKCVVLLGIPLTLSGFKNQTKVQAGGLLVSMITEWHKSSIIL